MKNYLEIMAPYSDLASWAIWESNRFDGEFFKEKDLIANMDFENYTDKLQKNNSVILAMNPGGKFDIDAARVVTRRKSENSRKWSNFHNVGRSRDYLLAQAIKDTELTGSYMTDIFPITGSKSDIIKEFIGNYENFEIVQNLILELDEELSLLFPDEREVKLFCLGRDTEKWATKYLVETSFPLNKNYKTYYLPHYSGANRSVSSKPESDNYYPKIVKELLKGYNEK